MSIHPRRWSLLLASALAISLVPMVSATANEPSSGVLAEFNGGVIDLAVDWEDAVACHVDGDGAVCFESEATMDAWLVETGRLEAELDDGALASNCASYLRLYDGTSYGGATLNLSIRSQWLNLSSYGFDQKTSSFKIGPCRALFADLTNGGGARYPSYLTEAYDQSSSMISGWDNDVSSVYIY
jgi:hypothetical protein